MSALVFRRLLALVVAVVLAGGTAAACSTSSGDDADGGDTSTTETTGDDGSSDTVDTDTSRLRPPDDVADVSLPEGTEMSEVTCSVGSDFNDEGATEVDCSESHEAESFTLEGAEDLDDCYRALAETTDLVIVYDSDGELDIDDERVNGHSFAGGIDTYDCEILLAEPRTEPLIQR